jgi:hypothetical protein
MHSAAFSHARTHSAALEFNLPHSTRLATLQFVSAHSSSSRRAPGRLVASRFNLPCSSSSRHAVVRLAALSFVAPGPQLIARALFVSSRCSPSHRTVLRLVAPQVVSPCLDSIYRAPDGLAARQFASPDPTSSRRALGRLAALGSVQPHSNPPCHAPGRLVAPQGSSLRPKSSCRAVFTSPPSRTSRRARI